MAYEPVNNTIDISKIVENLFAYLEANNADAIDRAKGDLSLPEFKKIYKSSKGRISTLFPCLMLIDKSVATDFSGDVLKVALRFLFEGQIQGGDADLLAENAEYYAMATESMLVNIPPNELCDGTMSVFVADIDSIETNYDEARQNKSISTAFLQVYQTEVIYLFEGAINNNG